MIQLRILNELEEDAGGLHDRQPASMIIIDRWVVCCSTASIVVSRFNRRCPFPPCWLDPILLVRTCDLAGPCSFGVSLLDRVLALLPQTTTDENLQSGFHNTMVREQYSRSLLTAILDVC